MQSTDSTLLLLLLLSCFSRVRLCATHRRQPTRLPAPGILQARTLEWVAISFPNAWKWKVKVKSLSRARLPATPWTAAYQAPPPMGFSRQEYWSGVPLPSPNGCIVFFFLICWCIVLICFSLMTRNVEHIFLCLLAIYLSSLVRCLFRSLTQFLIK